MAASVRSAKLDLRLTPEDKRLLIEAAHASQRSVSDFVLEAARRLAHETLPDRRHFGLGARQWQAFLKALDAPPRPLPRLARLLKEPSPFEKDRK